MIAPALSVNEHLEELMALFNVEISSCNSLGTSVGHPLSPLVRIMAARQVIYCLGPLTLEEVMRYGNFQRQDIDWLLDFAVGRGQLTLIQSGGVDRYACS